MPESLPPAPQNPYGVAPLRRAHSVRRTSSIDMSWPEGRGSDMCMLGRARDIYTPAEGAAPIVLLQDMMTARIGWDRTIKQIEAAPAREKLQKLVGQRGGGYLRGVLDEVMPEERANASPLHLLLDDISGASLVGGWAWSRWLADWRTAPPANSPAGAAMAAAAAAARAGAPAPQARTMVGICSGFRPGSSALNPDGTSSPAQSSTPVPLVVNPEDPAGWHPLPTYGGPSMRRHRRIDVWIEGPIQIEAMFQDSATAPQGGRVAVHEYALRATADPRSGELLSVSADPRILPYPECPTAAGNAGRLIGTPMAELRHVVLEMLKGTAGCTHLNDALRALAEVPALAARLERADANAA